MPIYVVTEGRSKIKDGKKIEFTPEITRQKGYKDDVFEYSNKGTTSDFISVTRYLSSYFAVTSFEVRISEKGTKENRKDNEKDLYEDNKKELTKAFSAQLEKEREKLKVVKKSEKNIERQRKIEDLRVKLELSPKYKMKKVYELIREIDKEIEVIDKRLEETRKKLVILEGKKQLSPEDSTIKENLLREKENLREERKLKIENNSDKRQLLIELKEKREAEDSEVSLHIKEACSELISKYYSYDAEKSGKSYYGNYNDSLKVKIYYRNNADSLEDWIEKTNDSNYELIVINEGTLINGKEDKKENYKKFKMYFDTNLKERIFGTNTF